MDKKRIVLIDDDKDFSDLMRFELEGKGYDVACAYNGHDGITMVKAHRPDLIILDVMLPAVDGLSVARLLKFDTKYKDIPILIFSSRDDIDAQTTAKVGADTFVKKSADSRELFEKIEAILRPPPLVGPVPHEAPLAASQAPREREEVTQAQTVDELKTKIRQLTAVNEIVYDISRTEEVDECIRVFIEKVSTLLTANVSSFMLLDKKRDELVVKLAKGLKAEIVKGTRMKLGEGVSGKVAQDAKPIFMKDMKEDPQFKASEGRSYKTDSFISVPLVVDNHVLGVINVTDKKDRTNFTDEEFKTLVAIADKAAASLKTSMACAELKTINHVKFEFLAILTHELKAPLVNVRSSIDVLLEESRNVLSDAQIQFLSAARHTIERLLRLVDDLLEMSKLESGAIEFRRETLDLAEIARRTLASFRVPVEKKSIALTTSLPERQPIWGDRDRMEEVFYNLLSNAVKFTPDHGRIHIAFDDMGDEVKVSVRDTGPGISPDDMPRLFDKFSTMSITQGIVDRGTGLGLSIAHDIVRLHKGSLWAESEPGKGSTFYVQLPKDLRKEVART